MESKTKIYLDEFWKKFQEEAFHPNASLLYFYLVHQIESNGWRPYSTTDLCIADNLDLPSVHIPRYREQLEKRGLIKFIILQVFPAFNITYELPEISMPPAITEEKRGLIQTAEDMTAEKERAAGQAKEIVKIFLSPHSRASLEIQLMQNKVDFDTYKQLVREVISDWIEAGVTHIDHNGNFDLKEAIRHLQNAVRKKAYLLRQLPATRKQQRQDLISAAYERLNKVKLDLLEYEKEENPF